MADTIRIQVKVEGQSKAEQDLSKLQNLVKDLNAKPVTINVKVDGDAKALKAAAQLESATARRVKAENELKIAQEKTKQATERRVAAETKATASTQKLGQATEETARHTETLWDNFMKFARWYIVGGAFVGITRALREALQTMKAVDDELVVVRKVTGMAGEELARLEKQAYQTASAYGVAADQFLNSVAAFSRAGYGEAAAGLAELAIKTELVGDVDKETANQFLLSVDAAYKYKGSVEELSKVLDGANEIDNKYATSIQKIAEGLGIVAPVAAQAHVTIGELTAAIGTITAVTQRSGTEAARAFRALMLNILGDTKTEIDEGVTWTTGEIAGLRDVIKLYAPEAYKAAQATGTLIDPMKAIGGLAQSMKDGLLTEQELMSMVSDIGGKLRSSQLLALIQNWDMYESMLSDYANSIGSADREVQNALDSWTRKSEILNNKWTEFVSHLVNTETIKGGLDIVIKLVEALDTDFGKAVVTSGALAAGLAIVASTIKGLVAAISALNMEMFVSPLFLGAAALAGILTLVNIANDLTATFEEQEQVVKELNKQLESMTGAGSEYDTLINKAGELTDIEKKRLEVLEAQIEALREQALEENKTLFRKRSGQANRVANPDFHGASEIGGAVDMNTPVTITQDEGIYRATNAQLEKLKDNYENVDFSMRNYRDGVRSLIREQSDYIEQLEEWKEMGFELTEVEEARIEQYHEMLDISASLTEQLEEQTENTEEQEESVVNLKSALSSAFEELNNLTKSYDALQDAVDEFNTAGQLSAETLLSLTQNDLLQYLEFTEAGLRINEDALNDQAEAARISAIQTLQDAAAQDILALATGNVSDLSPIAASAIAGMGNNAATAGSQAQTAAGQVAMLAGSLQMMIEAAQGNLTGVDAATFAAEANAIKDRYMSVANQIANITIKPTGGSSKSGRRSSGGGSRSSASKAAEDEAKAVEEVYKEMKEGLSETLEDMEHQIFLWEKKGNMSAAIIDQYKKMQDEVHALAEKYRAMGLDENSDYIQDLQKQWWKYQDAIQGIVEDLWEELEDAVDKELKNAQKARDDELAAINAQIDALKSTADTEDELLTLEEKRLAVLKAEQNLLNAQNERTVRVYNAATGQWEWNADQNTVNSAQQALDAAQKDLEEYTKELALNEEIAALEARKDAIEAEYDAFEAEWKRILESIETPARDIGEILADINKNGTKAMRKAVTDVVAVLNDLANYSRAAIGSTTGASYVGGGGTASGNYSADKVDYAALMLSAPDEATFRYYASQRSAKIESQGINLKKKGYLTNEQLYEQWKGSQYDSGGILRGVGGIKATTRDEAVLPPGLTAAMMAPNSSRVFRERLAQLGYLFGSKDNSALSRMGLLTNSNTNITHNGGPYYINGIEIGDREANSLTIAQLAQKARVLSLHAAI